MALAIVRTEHSADELRDAARRTTDTWQARRLLAIALVLDGASRTAAARAAGMERQTLRDWVIRYNEEGIEGLHDRPRTGRPPRLEAAERKYTTEAAGLSGCGRSKSPPPDSLSWFGWKAGGCTRWSFTGRSDLHVVTKG